jgi:hypothetical protein
MKRIPKMSAKLLRAYRHAGARIAGRVHVASSVRQLLRECRKTFVRKYRTDPTYRDARRSVYRGAIKAHKTNRQLVIDCRFDYLGVGSVA